jgi:D-xylose transport system permease protein
MTVTERGIPDAAPIATAPTIATAAAPGAVTVAATPPAPATPVPGLAARWLSAAAQLSARRWPLRNYTLLLVVAVIWIAFQILTDGIFLSQRNLALLALQSSIVSLAAISAVMLIVTRNFDLSVGSAVALVGAVLAILTVRLHVQPGLACLAAVACGVLLGAWQGLWVTRLGVSSFIVTLAGLLYFRGISMILADGATIAPLPASLTAFATGFLAPAPSILLIVLATAGVLALRAAEARRSVRFGLIPAAGPRILRVVPPALLAMAAAVWIARAKGLPNLVLLVAACAVAGHLLMSRTRYGAQLYAIGGNPDAARLAGIDVRRAVFVNFLIAGLAYGITGIALTARVSGSVPGSAGLFLELDAIAAAVIGGTALAGGRGAIFGALLGATLMGSLNNGLSLMNVETFYQDTVRGAVLLLAVAVDQYGRPR